MGRADHIGEHVGYQYPVPGICELMESLILKQIIGRLTVFKDPGLSAKSAHTKCEETHLSQMTLGSEQ